jgi:hypothetical protein
MRIRMRHLQALRAGMNNAEATAYANDPNSKLSLPTPTEPEITAALLATGGIDASQTNSGEGNTQFKQEQRLQRR